MSGISLIQFEDKDGHILSDVLQVPNSIEVLHLKSLINTSQDLYLNGSLIFGTLENALKQNQIDNLEEIKKIRLSQDLPSSKPAFYCSSAFSGHEGPVLATKYCKSILVTTGGDKTVRFWDLITKTQIKVVQKHNHWVVCVDSNNEYIVSGGMDGLVNIYDYKGNHIRTLTRHKDGISAIKITNNKIISCSRDATCIVWDLNGNILFSWNHSKAIKSLCVFGDFILTGGSDNKLRVYKEDKKIFSYFCDLVGHNSQINCIEAKGDFIISGDDNGQIIIWKNFKVHKRLNHKKEIISLCFNPNELSFASGSFDKKVCLWSLETGEILGTYYHVNLVYKVKVYNDMIISSSKDKTIKMYKISSGKIVSNLVCEDEIYDFDYFDGRLVCGCKNNKVYFFD